MKMMLETGDTKHKVDFKPGGGTGHRGMAVFICPKVLCLVEVWPRIELVVLRSREMSYPQTVIFPMICLGLCNSDHLRTYSHTGWLHYRCTFIGFIIVHHICIMPCSMWKTVNRFWFLTGVNMKITVVGRDSKCCGECICVFGSNPLSLFAG